MRVRISSSTTRIVEARWCPFFGLSPPLEPADESDWELINSTETFIVFPWARPPLRAQPAERILVPRTRRGPGYSFRETILGLCRGDRLQLGRVALAPNFERVGRG